MFEEMKIPINIDQLTKIEKYEEDSTEVIDWFNKNGFSRGAMKSKTLTASMLHLFLMN